MYAFTDLVVYQPLLRYTFLEKKNVGVEDVHPFE